MLRHDPTFAWRRLGSPPVLPTRPTGLPSILKHGGSLTSVRGYNPWRGPTIKLPASIDPSVDAARPAARATWELLRTFDTRERI